MIESDEPQELLYPGCFVTDTEAATRERLAEQERLARIALWRTEHPTVKGPKPLLLVAA